jgi:hypothetical protein
MNTLAILTKNKAASFRRCLVTLRDNAEEFGHDVRFVVADDSTDPTPNRQTLEEVGVSFTHLDRACREGFIQDLGRRSGCPEELLRYALLPDGDVAMGAVRNFLTLVLAGQQFITIDDDMVCKFAAVPGSSDEIIYSLKPTREFQTCWIIDGVDEKSLSDEDFIGKHEQLFNAAVKPSLVAGGSVGDSGATNAYYGLIAPEVVSKLDSYERMLQVLCNRQVLRSTTNPQIVNWVICPGMSLGLDASTLLPPFFPMGRGEDVLFGTMLMNCLKKPSAYCNYAMWHTSARKADLVRDLETIAFPTFPEFIYILVCQINPQSLGEFGQVLRQIANDEKFKVAVVDDWRKRAIGLFSARAGGLPEFIARESQKVQRAYRAAAPYEIPAFPIEKYGELLAAWPSVFEAAKTYGEY